MFLHRGIVFSHEAVRAWEAKLAPALAGELRRRRRGKGGARGRDWHVDETYLKVRGRWAYLYRAIDRDGRLVDTMLSERRDMAAAQAFFRSAKAATGQAADRVTTDGHGSYPRAIRTALGRRGRASDQRVQEQRTGAGPPRHQGPHPMHARLQELPLSRSVLSKPRRTPQLPPPPHSPQPACPRHPPSPASSPSCYCCARNSRCRVA